MSEILIGNVKGTKGDTGPRGYSVWVRYNTLPEDAGAITLAEYRALADKEPYKYRGEAVAETEPLTGYSWISLVLSSSVPIDRLDVASSDAPLSANMGKTLNETKEPAFTKNSAFNKNFGTATPVTPTTNAGTAGVAETVARSDHRHAQNYSTSVPAAPTANGSAGSSNTVSRGDHVHPGIPYYSMSNGYYMKLPNGMLIQWGRVNNPNGSTFYTPIAFSDNSWTLNYSLGNSSESSLPWSSIVGNRSGAASFRLDTITASGSDYSRNNNNYGFWFGIGKY
jgi:hypothetical protein